ncbi:MAG: peptidyl-prolyl cis-trans isomerase, partial [Desulfobacteraceae bacterium]|nr:peptidyl-prolyl cis-trans isomerase [Desulfobacteraceae bacterium]
LEQAAEFAKTAFALEKQQISDVKQIGNDYFIISIKETIAPAQLPLEAVKDRVADTLAREQRMAAAQTRAQELLEAAKASETLEKMAQKKNLTLSSTPLFTRNDSIQGIGRSADFTRAAFALDRENPLCPNVLQTDEGFFIISFKDKQVPAPDEIQQNLTDIRQQLLDAKKGQYYQAWINELKEKSHIEINPQFIN